MFALSFDRFDEFFRDLHGHPPYSWQTRLAAGAVEGDWPGAIDLPTGSGKTACIDVAVFALACQASRAVPDRTAPRRIFFCVNRRVIVDEAYQRAKRIALKLREAERNGGQPSPILREVAAALRLIAGTDDESETPPLDVLELRGGIYRDNRWARSVTQPTVICTTTDQLGSRLLFRGYGVSPNAAPIQAALVAYDSLILLDEAHISQPFRESLRNAQRFLDPEKWAAESIGVRPMIAVPMTATPPTDIDPNNVIRLDDGDRRNESLDARLKTAKPASLRRVADVSKAIAELAESHAEAGNLAIGIVVNRVATAKEIYHRLCQNCQDTELVIGSMRPIDRDEQSDRLARLVGTKRPELTEKTSFVVATQCLEVGADYDFDVLITECASLDALRQRFGRLNRGGRPIEARAVVVVKDKDVKPDGSLDDEKPLDPIYGNALARTWNWLWERDDAENPPDVAETPSKPSKAKAKLATETRTIDFGIDAFDRLLHEQTGDTRVPKKLLSPSAFSRAPVMLPAYVDFWCQTFPIPVPDPDVALFIHGEQRSEPDVQVCWRVDLLEDGLMTPDHWCEVVALLPPTSAECMSVPISRVRRWLLQEADGSPDLGDLFEGVQQAADSDVRDRNRAQYAQRRGVLWRGADKSVLLGSPNDVRPGDTLVLPVSAQGWQDLGHIPPTTSKNHVAAGKFELEGSTPQEVVQGIDVAEAAFQAARAKHVLRLHPSRRESLPKDEAIDALFEHVADPDESPTMGELRDLLREAADGTPDDYRTLRASLEHLANRGFTREPYPDSRGIVLTGRVRARTDDVLFIPSLDEGDDDASRIGRETPVSLPSHTGHVAESVARTLELIDPGVSRELYALAAERHDWGKADDRFQALLRGTSRTDAWLFAGGALEVLAKSDGVPRTPRERQAARERSGLPDGFRHEMLSVQLAELAAIPEHLAADRDLILHLIAAHHGYARPFAPVVIDEEAPDVEYASVVLSSAARSTRPAHCLDSGIADRFWYLSRRFGWWGLAYLEALLRLADQQASADEDAGEYENEMTAASDENHK
jgi:CRISPR-associated endonuclease/helicase Cas3